MSRKTLRLTLFLMAALLLVSAITLAQNATPTPSPEAATEESTAEATVEATPTPSPTPTPTVEVVDNTENTIAAIAKDTPELLIFVAALEATGLTDTLNDGGSFTVFAPTDAAFKALPAGELAALLKDKAALGKVLLYHVVVGGALADDALKAKTLLTLSGDNVTVTRTDTMVLVNDANAGLKVIQASNGVIYLVDKVLTPPPPAAEATSEATSEAIMEVTAEATAAP